MISSPGAGLLASVNYNTDQLVFSIGRAAWCLVQRPAAPWRLNQSHLCSRGLTPYTGFLRRPLTTERWKCHSVKGVHACRKVIGILVLKCQKLYLMTDRQKLVIFKLNFIALLTTKHPAETRFLETFHFFHSCDIRKPGRNTINKDGENY